MGGCALGWATFTVNDFSKSKNNDLRIGFRNDAPQSLWRWSAEALWTEKKGDLIHCNLCPHECILAEKDRGFCRTRVVLDGMLHTIAYGNPCSAHIDPVEKKPLYHFLPSSQVLSIATAGCNLRCLNCQNWQISQSKPEETKNLDLMPAALVDACKTRNIPLIAYTYSEPIIFYEYVMESSQIAHSNGIRNVLVTAGYIKEKPLQALCKVTDAANVDLKGFSDIFYRKVTGAKLQPVLNALKVLRSEGVWLEITKLIVPTLSEDLDDLKAMCDWLAANLGPGTPLHLSRFHPTYKLKHLPPTPVETMEIAYNIAIASGLHFVYIGNVPGSVYQNTVCPKCGEHVIKRSGYIIIENLLDNGRCPCGEIIPGVWT